MTSEFLRIYRLAFNSEIEYTIARFVSYFTGNRLIGDRDPIALFLFKYQNKGFNL